MKKITSTVTSNLVIYCIQLNHGYILRLVISDWLNMYHQGATMTSSTGGGAQVLVVGWHQSSSTGPQSKHTKESDVFALGLVLHFLLTFGKHPFVSNDQETRTFMIEKKIVEKAASICPISSP